MSTYLQVKWTVSRGYETYGYNIVTLTDTATGTKHRTMGGGYDMVGEVFGDWLTRTFPAELEKLDPADWYGMRTSTGMVGGGGRILDGACGLASMRAIAEAIGLEVAPTVDRKGNTTGFMVTSQH